MNELHKNAHILIVDDDEDDFIITSSYIRAIQSSQFTIDWARSYKDGLEQLSAGKYHLFFVDYRLGAKSGVDFLKEAQHMGCETPIILLTGQGNHKIDIEAMESGAVDYLIKAELSTEKTERCIRYALGRAQTLQALKRSESKFRSIFEKSKDIVFIADRSLRLTDVNETIHTLLGLKSAQGVMLTDLVTKEEDRTYITEATKKGTELNDYPINLTASDGSTLTCTLSLATEDDGDNGYIQGIIHDITSLKKAEKATLQTEKLAATGRLVRTLAHEIKNPLNNIAMSAEYLSSASQNEDDKLYLEIIQRNGSRINDLITELLQSSNPRDNTLQPHTLQQITDEVLVASYDKLTLKKISPEIHYPDVAVMVLADKGNIKLALLNIVINAIEAMEENKGVLSISVRHGDRAVLTISDNGCGISEENIGRIFEPYYTRKRSGAGLGLAFTLNILKAHNASIEVSSTLGKGTVFTITFPPQQNE